MEIYRSVRRRVPEADDLRDGRQEPRDRQPPGRPRRRGRGDGPLGVRAVRPEVLGRVPGVRGAPGRPRPSSRGWSSGPRPSSRRPARPRHLHRPGRRRGRGGAVRAGRRTRRGRTGDGAGRRRTACPRARSAAATTSSRPSCGSRATSWIWTTELFVPLVAVDVVDSLDEAITRANDTPLGLTAGLFSARRRRDRRVPRPASRPASSTSTGGPARRRARGRACSPSAAGRARGPTGRRAAARTTCSSTCASRAGRSWRSRDDGPHGADAGRRHRARARDRAARAGGPAGDRAGPGA